MATTEFEVVLSVRDYKGSFDDAQCATDDAKQQAIDEICSDLMECGYSEKQARKMVKQVKVTRIRFEEFDSSNPTHADAYFLATVSGPKKIIDIHEYVQAQNNR